jgi:hypothetical protein
MRTTSGAGSPSGGTNTLAGVSDHVLWYSKNLDQVKYRQLFQLRSRASGGGLYGRVLLEDGSTRPATPNEASGADHLPRGARVFRPADLTSQSSPDSATVAERASMARAFTYRDRRSGQTNSNKGMKARSDGMLQGYAWAQNQHVAAIDPLCAKSS